MQHYVAILRGINVSGKNKIPMAVLRELLAKHGWKHLQTYIQSGNVTFKAAAEDHGRLATLITDSIKDHFGFDIPVIVLTAQDLEHVVAQNPFAGQDLSKLHITFLAEKPSDDLVATLPPSSNPRETFVVKDRSVYVYCPDGYGSTKINNLFFEKKLGVTATTRNWRTCLKLLEMTAGG